MHGAVDLPVSFRHPGEQGARHAFRAGWDAPTAAGARATPTAARSRAAPTAAGDRTTCTAAGDRATPTAAGGRAALTVAGGRAASSSAGAGAEVLVWTLAGRGPGVHTGCFVYSAQPCARTAPNMFMKKILQAKSLLCGVWHRVSMQAQCQHAGTVSACRHRGAVFTDFNCMNKWHYHMPTTNPRFTCSTSCPLQASPTLSPKVPPLSVCPQYILSVAGFPYPIALTCIHMGFGSVLAFVIVKLGLAEATPISADMYIR
eukprot:365070-Chlamydomonas_euryale.AAC.9